MFVGVGGNGQKSSRRGIKKTIPSWALLHETLLGKVKDLNILLKQSFSLSVGDSSVKGHSVPSQLNNEH